VHAWPFTVRCGLLCTRSAGLSRVCSEKDAFRRDPDAPAVAHLRYLKTRRGTRLLTRYTTAQPNTNPAAGDALCQRHVCKGRPVTWS
jgi:hypothetical protein